VRFLADMGVDVRVVEWLRREGHEARHLRDEGLQRMPDGEIFDKAIAEGRILLTFDLDFGEIAALSRGRRASVILFRLRHPRAPHVIARLGAVLEGSRDALEHGSVVLVEDSRHRIRRLPIGEGPG
jgi:predicted nuclease of predicted toxin-antitoxin system